MNSGLKFGVFFALLILGFLAISSIMVYSGDNWVKVPVRVGDVDCGKLFILLSDDHFKSFVYEDLEGRQHSNDWKPLVDTIKEKCKER